MLEQNDDTLQSLAPGQSSTVENAEPTGDQQSLQGQENTNQQPTWNGQEWALNFKGQQIIPKDRQHLVNLAQKGYSYESAMEQLNQERQKLTQQGQSYQKYSQLDEALQGNQEFARKLWDFVQQNKAGQQQQQQGEQQSELPPQVSSALSELEELKSWKQQLQEQQANQAIEKEINDLASQYPNYEWQADDGTGTLAWKIMKHAYDNGITSMKMAFRDMMFDKSATTVKMDTLKQAKETQQAQHRQGVVQSSGAPTNMPMKKSGYSPADSYNELTQKALASLGG